MYVITSLRATFQIQYEANEWEKLEAKLIGLGLQKSTTNNFFGSGRSGVEYYRTPDSAMQNLIRNAMPEANYTLDAINSPVYSNESFNVAIFRVIPDSNGLTPEINLNKLLTIKEVNDLCNKITQIYTTLFNLIDAEVRIHIKSNL